MKLVPGCPYCGYKFEGTPSRKDHCPKCDHDVYLRNMPDDDTYRLYSEFAVKMIDKVWENQEVVERFNCDLPTGYNLVPGWEKWFNKYKSKADPYEYLWFILNEWLVAFAEAEEFVSMKKIYLRMAVLCEERQQDAYTFRKETIRMDLLHNLKMSQQNDTQLRAVIECGDKVCEKCSELKNNEYTINEALDIMPIPNKECAKGSSECRYVYHTMG